MNRSKRLFLLSALVLFAMVPTLLMAKGNGEDRVHFFQSITVERRRIGGRRCVYRLLDSHVRLLRRHGRDLREHPG